MGLFLRLRQTSLAALVLCCTSFLGSPHAIASKLCQHILSERSQLLNSELPQGRVEVYETTSSHDSPLVYGRAVRTVDGEFFSPVAERSYLFNRDTRVLELEWAETLDQVPQRANSINGNASPYRGQSFRRRGLSSILLDAILSLHPETLKVKVTLTRTNREEYIRAINTECPVCATPAYKSLSQFGFSKIETVKPGFFEGQIHHIDVVLTR